MIDVHVVRYALGDLATAPIDVYLSEHDVFQPDLLFVAKDRSGIVRDDGVHGAPDLVVEILSVGTAHLDKNRKRVAYAASGVRELWLIDPILLQVHVYEFPKNPSPVVRVLDNNQVLESSVLPGFSMRVKLIFQD